MIGHLGLAVGCAVIMDESESFADKHHLGIESAISFKKRLVLLLPTLEGLVFTFRQRERFINITKAPLGYLYRLYNERRCSVPIEGSISSSNDRHCLASYLEVPKCAASCRFLAGSNQSKKLVAKGLAVAESEASQIVFLFSLAAFRFNPVMLPKGAGF